MNPTYPPYAPAKLAIFSNISNPTKAMLTHLSPSPPALPPPRLHDRVLPLRRQGGVVVDHRPL
ncbi:hypothetical protein [Paramuribaculum intestinale]|uniref:hypothetical protein n=1 Tax=Paramuribaculum intestinale TaxID=2094151 RepID=UPI0027295DB4|nr:hypothetical protein [Paramuribaculum intestinale]